MPKADKLRSLRADLKLYDAKLLEAHATIDRLESALDWVLRELDGNARNRLFSSFTRDVFAAMARNLRAKVR